MAKKHWISIGIVAVAVVLMVRYFGVGHRDPAAGPAAIGGDHASVTAAVRG